LKFVQQTDIIAAGPYVTSDSRRTVEKDLRDAIRAVVWPPGSTTFKIPPGRHLNGVPPIKNGFVAKLIERGWRGQEKYPKSDATTAAVVPGAFDVWRDLDGMPAVVAEWETGNISSSHRSINRMARAIMEGHAVAGYLVVPSRALYPHLTDRIGNFRELMPYFKLWSRLPLGNALLAFIEVEQDGFDPSVRPIPKGKDGNAVKAL
jgi:hypothetical protein